MMYKKCSKFHWRTLKSFNLIKTVYELFDNPLYSTTSQIMLSMILRLTFVLFVSKRHLIWNKDTLRSIRSLQKIKMLKLRIWNAAAFVLKVSCSR